MMNDVITFLDKIFAFLEEKQIDLQNWQIDHLCYRTLDQANYEASKKMFEELGELLIEADVNGRPIATYKFHKPVEYKKYSIPLVEVPAPKAGKETPEGWEHIEVVIDISFDELMAKYPDFDWNTKALSKEINPELVLKFGDCSIKFHHQSLEKVIEWEKKTL